MPVITRKMADNRKVSDASGHLPGQKLIRELPSSVDPSCLSSVAESAAPTQSKCRTLYANNTASSATGLSTNFNPPAPVVKKQSSVALVKKGGPKSASGKSRSCSRSSSSSSSSSSSASNTRTSSVAGASSQAQSQSNEDCSVVNLPKMIKMIKEGNTLFKRDSKPTNIPAAVSIEPCEAEVEMNERQIKFTIEMIRLNLKKISNNPGYVEHTEASFSKYYFDLGKKSKYVEPNSAEQVCDAKYLEFPEVHLVCKRYSPDQCVPGKSKFLKILRHIGKKHPNICGTWDIFFTGQMVLVIQEAAVHGNLKAHVAKKGHWKEARAQEAAKQILRAIDFLGDFGISHRAIEPKHVLIYRCSKDIQVKLSGFHEAIEYWDVEKEAIIFQDCRPQSDELAMSFQAPEVFGDTQKEIFDPILADIWSLGATIYYSLTKSYPYNTEKVTSRIGGEIEENVSRMCTSKMCQDILHKMLMIDSTKRIPFHMMYKHSWLKEG